LLLKATRSELGPDHPRRRAQLKTRIQVLKAALFECEDKASSAKPAVKAVKVAKAGRAKPHRKNDARFGTADHFAQRAAGVRLRIAKINVRLANVKTEKPARASVLANKIVALTEKAVTLDELATAEAVNWDDLVAIHATIAKLQARRAALGDNAPQCARLVTNKVAALVERAQVLEGKLPVLDDKLPLRRGPPPHIAAKIARAKAVNRADPAKMRDQIARLTARRAAIDTKLSEISARLATVEAVPQQPAQ